jgi:hypothetical protein
MYLKQTMFMRYTVFSCSVFTVCATCSVILHVNPQSHLPALLGAHPILHVSRIRVNMFCTVTLALSEEREREVGVCVCACVRAWGRACATQYGCFFFFFLFCAFLLCCSVLTIII